MVDEDRSVTAFFEKRKKMIFGIPIPGIEIEKKTLIFQESQFNAKFLRLSNLHVPKAEDDNYSTGIYRFPLLSCFLRKVMN